jgi:hypothetical protein
MKTTPSSCDIQVGIGCPDHPDQQARTVVAYLPGFGQAGA